MKKQIGVMLATLSASVVMACSLSSCNKQIIDWNYNFDRAYVKIGEEWQDLDIRTWTDYDDGEQIQLTLEDGTVLLVHSANCVLYNGQLPRG